MAAPIPAVERAIGNERRNRWANFVMLVEVGVACLALVVAGIVLAAKIDQKVSSEIVRSNCQAKAFAVIAKDVHLIFTGDRNPADYVAKLPKC